MKRLLCLLAALAVLLPRGHAAEHPCVALTFDDGPSGALTERLLDGLAARGVHATFFLCGYRIDLYPELAARRRCCARRAGCMTRPCCSRRPAPIFLSSSGPLIRRTGACTMPTP